MRIQLRALGLAFIAITLVACASVNNSPESANETLHVQRSVTVDSCEALYAEAPTGVVVSPELEFGKVGTLVLSFVENSVKTKAIDWMGSELGLGLGAGLGQLENLPMVVLETLITPGLIDSLIAEFEPQGLISIWQNEPISYYLNESAPYIGAPAARAAYGVTGEGVGVAVIDSGIDGTHPDLSGSVARNVKIVGSLLEEPLGGYIYADLPNTDLTSGHGTHVAGTIAGSGNVSGGTHTGIAPGAKLLGVGAGDAVAILFALEAFDFVLRPDIREQYDIRVISNSWGTSGTFDPYNPISLAIKRAYDAGIITVFAAGNDGPGEGTLNPYSASPCAISVAAGDVSGQLAEFSSRGTAGDAVHHPDITAPGVDITAARALTGLVTLPDLPNLFYSTISGTSMATPHVSGTLALMLEANPNLGFEEALQILQDTATPMFDASGNPYALHEVGAGYLDTYEAVQMALESNDSDHELVSETLTSWEGDIPLSVCVIITCITQSEDSFEFEVPEGVNTMTVSVEWPLVVEDVDLFLFGPDGNQVASSATMSNPEVVTVPTPEAGTWRAVSRGYINILTQYSGTVEVERLVPR